MRWLVPCLALFTLSCGQEGSSNLELLHMQEITLTNGHKIMAEVVTAPVDMLRGMMFRDSIAPDRGMLFVHNPPGTYSYHMYQVRIPLDILWLDTGHKIVDMALDVQPCKSKASECPQYGGHYRAKWVLELGGGVAARNGLKLGDTLTF